MCAFSMFRIKNINHHYLLFLALVVSFFHQKLQMLSYSFQVGVIILFSGMYIRCIYDSTYVISYIHPFCVNSNRMPYHTIQVMLFRLSIFRTCSLVSVTMVVVVGMFHKLVSVTMVVVVGMFHKYTI